MRRRPTCSAVPRFGGPLPSRALYILEKGLYEWGKKESEDLRTGKKEPVYEEGVTAIDNRPSFESS